MSESTNELQQMILQLQRESQKVDLKIFKKKTKVKFNNYIQDHEIKVDDEAIECIQKYIYLGQNWFMTRS